MCCALGAKKVAREKKIETSEVLYSTARVMEVNTNPLPPPPPSFFSCSSMTLFHRHLPLAFRDLLFGFFLLYTYCFPFELFDSAALL
jgi:hypothetical protein